MIDGLSFRSVSHNIVASIPEGNNGTQPLTVTSFHFNELSGRRSQWIDRLLDTQAFFVVDHEKKKEAYNMFNFSLPQSTRWPSCSVEMLAMVQLDVDEPISLNYKFYKPSIGTGSLSFGKHTTPCYYRAMYESWRHQGTHTNPNFWPVFVYCPIDSTYIVQEVEQQQQQSKCTILQKYFANDEHNIGKEFRFSLSLKTKTLSTSFHGHKPRFHFPQKTAVCLVLPYVDASSNVTVVQGAMISEFVRYYSSLDMKVIIYDRDGGHRQHLLNTQYQQQQQITFPFLYHNYTIKGLLDNNFLSKIRQDDYLYKRIILDTHDDDKTLTYTHCRFDARSVFGIDQVLAVDADEFLLCRRSKLSLRQQKLHIHQMIQQQRHRGQEQLSFYQATIAPTSLNPRQCAEKAIQQGNSILSCFQSGISPLKLKSKKSLHIGLSCPLTDFHQACSSNFGTNDCNCHDSWSDRCVFQHFSFDATKLSFKHVQQRSAAKNDILSMLLSSKLKSRETEQQQEEEQEEQGLQL